AVENFGRISGGLGSRPGSGSGGVTARVLRGAAWNNNAPVNLRSSYRNRNNPGNRNDNNGFRCVLVVGGGVRKVLRTSAAVAAIRESGEMLAGVSPLPARAKKPPNRPIRAPAALGKIRGAGRGR